MSAAFRAELFRRSEQSSRSQAFAFAFIVSNVAVPSNVCRCPPFVLLDVLFSVASGGPLSRNDHACRARVHALGKAYFQDKAQSHRGVVELA